MGHRMSALPIARFCGLSPRLGEQYGSGRPAAMGRAFHAVCAGEEGADKLLAALTEEECQQVMSWKRPTDVILDAEAKVVLKYADADKEQEVGLDVDGEYCEVSDKQCLTVGHIDFAWVVEVEGQKIAYVADIKKSEWTVTEGIDSLQLLAYGLAWASKHDCDGFAVGIWAAVEGQWQWSEIHDMFGAAAAVWEHVEHAASNTSEEGCTGAHCHGCYARLHCAEHLVPAAVAEANPALAIVTKEGAAIATDHEAKEALLAVRAMEDLVKLAKDQVKEYARRNGGIYDEETGKVYKAIKVKGRSRLDKVLLEKEHPGLIEKYTNEGNPSEQFRWVKAK